MHPSEEGSSSEAFEVAYIDLACFEKFSAGALSEIACLQVDSSFGLGDV